MDVELPGGVRTYYEVHGEGPPVVLLHGGMTDADSWAMQLPALADRRTCFLPERRGHGRTNDPDGPITFEAMAEDTVAFLEQVVGEPADLVGWSDGGNVGLLIALQRPELVRKLVVIGSNYHHDGLRPEAGAFFFDADPDGPDLAMMREPYQARTPDGAEHWPVVLSKMREMWVSGPTMTTDDLARIEAPTLVVVGDDDIVDHLHTVSLFESLPAGQLAVIPGTSHVAPMEKPALLNQLIVDFLDDGAPVRMLPIRSRP
jgi:pimeloyl-ACP methyl ester carboxylesterase